MYSKSKKEIYRLSRNRVIMNKNFKIIERNNYVNASSDQV